MGSRRTTALLTALAMLAFAANSLLCRAALSRTSIDPASFTGLRLASGAGVLALLVRRRAPSEPSGASWPSALALFVYAACFSFAYLRLSTGFGALLLFGAVQLCMIGWGLGRGERPSARGWAGLALAVAGLVGLCLPTGGAAPDPIGALLMAAAGVGWGAYSLRGRGTRSPARATAGNFLRALPLGAALWLAAGAPRDAPLDGALLACLSGALASGLGYALWYAALPGLLAVEASVVQLSVPVIAALLGIGLLGERPSARLVLAGAAILLGIALTLRDPRRT